MLQRVVKFRNRLNFFAENQKWLTFISNFCVFVANLGFFNVAMSHFPYCHMETYIFKIKVFPRFTPLGRIISISDIYLYVLAILAPIVLNAQS